MSSLVLSSNGADRTQTGHVLGYPQRRGEAVVSDRQLSPATFLLLRLLTHLAMLWGAAQNHQVSVLPPGYVSSYESRDLLQVFTLSPAV